MLATILSYTMITPDVVELILDIPSSIPYKAGQRALLSYADTNAPLKRAYSIVDYRVTGDHCQITLAIKLRSGGKGSENLRRMKSGDTIEVAGIYGMFVLQDTPNPKVFVATGTGIAPLISMANRTTAPKSLYFSVSYSKDLFYAEKIHQIPNLESHIHITREKMEGCEEGRIDLSKPNFPPESEFYICGSPESVSSFVEILKSRGYEKMYTEKY